MLSCCYVEIAFKETPNSASFNLLSNDAIDIHLLVKYASILIAFFNAESYLPYHHHYCIIIET